MKITRLDIPQVMVFEPKYFEDYRGYYSEVYSARTLKEFDINDVFVQDNHSFTLKKGTIRGIHFQNDPKSQIKLVRCTRGKVLDFAIDLRKGSPTYKKWVCVELSESNRKQIYIPHGFGHAFITLEDNCEVLYKVTEFYSPELDRAIAWNDPSINLPWPITDPIISVKDMNAPTLDKSDVNFVYKG